MDIKEAIRILHPDTTAEAIAEIEYYGGFKGKVRAMKAVNEACIVACEALEKRIPKKPIKIEKKHLSNYNCPNCNHGLGNTVMVYRQKCCDVCGQARECRK